MESNGTIKCKCEVCGYSGKMEYILAKDYNRKISDDVFTYTICPRCECMSLYNVPENLGVYYGSGYYSFSLSSNETSFFTKIKNYYIRLIDYYYLTGRSFMGFCLSLWMHDNDHFKYIKYLAKKDSSIVDIGCGDGYLIKRLAEIGYTDLTGVDAFVPDEKLSDKNVKLIKGDAFSLERKYDLIILSHSFEHMSNPNYVIKKLSESLNDDGVILLTIPVSKSRLFRKYGKFWSQLDAPRHLFLHTPKSMKIICHNNGLKISRAFYDSSHAPYIYTLNNYLNNCNNKFLYSIRNILFAINYFFSRISCHNDNYKKQSDQMTFIIKK